MELSLRDDVAFEVNNALARVGLPRGWEWEPSDVLDIADAILALPEIKEALEFMSLKPEMLAEVKKISGQLEALRKDSTIAD